MKKKTLPKSSSQEPNLKGTIISVSIIGLIIVASWFGVFGLFLSR
ncbi:cytochrome c oxidase subunit 2A [Oceanobacillus sp. Castelsardo]|nr:cytochrome c oxidase subunit 2A [Oceanobacillus sp. Castelsardo]